MNRFGLVLLWSLSVVLPAAAGPWQGFTALAISADGRSFATGGREGEVLWFESATGEVRARWVLPGGRPVVGIVFDTEGLHAGAVTLDGTSAWLAPVDLKPLAVQESAVEKTLSEARDRWMTAAPLVAGLQITSGDFRVQGTPGGRISVGSVSGGKPLVTWQAHEAAVTGLALAPDSSFLISAAYDGTLRRWDPHTGRDTGRL